MNKELPHRILVTGASSGIGLALAERLIARGDHVIALDRNPCPAKVAQYVKCDLSDWPEISRRLSGIEEPISGLANVAGIPGTYPPDVVLSVNVLGVLAVTRAAVSLMSPGAAIVNVASLSATRSRVSAAAAKELHTLRAPEGLSGWLSRYPLSGPEAYDFSKKFVRDWTAEYAASQIDCHLRVNSVSPGAVDTPILEDFRASMGRSLIDGAHRELGRHASPHEVAAVLDFLLSPASSWVNGIDVVADGGLLAIKRSQRKRR